MTTYNEMKPDRVMQEELVKENGPTAYGRHLLTPLSEWRHEKTGSTYTVIGVALCSTNGPGEHTIESVVYWSKAHQALRYRLLYEFLDSRFVPLNADGKPMTFGPQQV